MWGEWKEGFFIIKNEGRIGVIVLLRETHELRRYHEAVLIRITIVCRKSGYDVG